MKTYTPNEQIKNLERDLKIYEMRAEETKKRIQQKRKELEQGKN
jgi:hypothetical protein